MASKKLSNKSRALFTGGLMVVLTTGFLLFSSGDERTVLLPVMTVLLLVIPALVNSFDRNGGVPISDIGALYLVVLTLYFVFPIATYWARGMRFTEFNDARLYAAMPTQAQIAAVEWRYVAYILPFVIVYLLAAPTVISRPKLLNANPRIFFWTVLILAGVEAEIKVFDVINKISGGNYSDVSLNNLEAHRNVPHLLAQIDARCDSMAVVAQAATLVFLFCRYKKYRLVIFAWLSIEAITVVGGLGARTPLVLLILMMAILYDRFVNRIKPLAALCGAVLFLSGYLVFGFVRSQTEGAVSRATFTNSGNEFEALFANAFDLYRRAENGTLPPVPAQVRFADFIAPIPSQLLPFEKLDKAVWYTRVLGIENTGGGYAFGVISEGAIGWGSVELALQGMLTAYLLALLQRWYRSNSQKYWVLVIYLYCEVSCYWLFRQGTFYFVPLLFLNVLPFYLAVRLLSARSKRSPTQLAGVAPSQNPRLYPRTRVSQ
jgi:hypothetical protein